MRNWPLARLRRRTLLAIMAILVGTAGLPPGVWAQVLTIGLSSEPNSVDPLYLNTAANADLFKQIFDRLVHQDERQHLVPGLAISWRPVDDQSWEFILRDGVKFHDGTPLTADDVAFSLERADTMSKTLSGFGPYVKAVKGIEVVDARTIRIRTDGPYPLLPEDLSSIAIQSRLAAEGKSTADFNRGDAAIGTGPFRFLEWTPGGPAVLRRNDDYWGPRPDWETVILKPIVNGASRTAALLSGDVDVIEDVPVADLPRLRNEPGVRLTSAASSRLIYLALDVARDRSPFIADKDGEPLGRNPLKDLRVRQAISKAINRDELVAQVMEGAAVPAGQLMPEGFSGMSPWLAPERSDPEAARRLLAEAGYPDGFQVTLHGPQGRWLNDDKVLQAVAQMLARIGIETKVVTVPATTYVPRGTEFSLKLMAWATDTGEASSSVRGVLATYDEKKGWGAGNPGRYSNAEIDRLLGEAFRTFDREDREALLRRATELGIADFAVVPLYHQLSTWASRRGARVVGGGFPETLAINVHRAEGVAARSAIR